MLSRFRYILLFGIVLFSALKAVAQISMPDNVYVGTVKHYWVDSIIGSGSTYTWKIDHVVQQNGHVNLFSIKWNTTGVYFLEVQKTAINNCDSEVKSGWVYVIAAPTPELTVSAIYTNIKCPGDATGIATAIVTGGTEPYSYLWNTSPVQTSSTVSGLVAGTYIVTITDRNGRLATLHVTIDFENSLPAVDYTSSLSGLNTYSFINASTNAMSYIWDFGDGQISTSVNPIHVYATSGTYTVKLTVSNSCGTDLIRRAITIPELEFFNGFSPNGDDQNDNWNIPVLNYYPVNSVLIINRWGSEIWKGINYDNKDIVWTGKNMNGEDMPDGTYYYIINYNNTEKRGWVFIKR
jgi:gliding motility-associated-like protein